MQNHFTISVVTKSAIILVFGIVFLLSTPKAAAENPSSKVERFQRLVEKWVGIHEELATEKREWKQRKQMLNSEIDALENKKQALSEKISTNSRRSEDLKRKKENLANQSEQLKKVLSALSSDLEKTEEFLLEIKEQLPEFMRDKMRKQFNQLSSYKNDPEELVHLGDRLNLVISAIKSINKADNSLHCKSTIVENSKGDELEVTALYLGLSKAFAVSPDGSFCAIGTPQKTGWKWARKSALADKVQKSIAIFKQEKEAAFVDLPLNVGTSNEK